MGSPQFSFRSRRSLLQPGFLPLTLRPGALPPPVLQPRPAAPFAPPSPPFIPGAASGAAPSQVLAALANREREPGVLIPRPIPPSVPLFGSLGDMLRFRINPDFLARGGRVEEPGPPTPPELPERIVRARIEAERLRREMLQQLNEQTGLSGPFVDVPGPRVPEVEVISPLDRLLRMFAREG